MITVILYGAMAKKFGKTFELKVTSLAKAIRLLEANFPGKFSQMVTKDAFYITMGKVLGDHENLDEKRIALNVPDGTVFRLIPKAVGSASTMKKKGLGSILLGVVLLGASLIFPATFGMAGVLGGLSLVAGGASLLLSPAVGGKEDDKMKSYAFSGAVNSEEQGQVEPVAYGRRIKVGSVVMAGTIRSRNSKKDDT